MIAIFLGKGFIGYYAIATAGMVGANSSTLIWKDWDVSTDAILEIFTAAGFEIEIKDYDRLLLINTDIWDRYGGRFFNVFNLLFKNHVLFTNFQTKLR